MPLTTWRGFLAVTGLVHALLAAVVARDASRRGRSVTWWSAATLLSGVVGAAAYVRTR